LCNPAERNLTIVAFFPDGQNGDLFLVRVASDFGVLLLAEHRQERGVHGARRPGGPPGNRVPPDQHAGALHKSGRRKVELSEEVGVRIRLLIVE
jgi:hypothetical protein